MLAPGRPERSVQFLDVRDLVEWKLDMLEDEQTDIYRANGLPEAVSAELLQVWENRA